LAGRNGRVYGWGLIEDLAKDLAPVSQLRHVDEPLVDQALCNSSHPILGKIMSDTSFCAGARDGETGPCNGKILSLVLNLLSFADFCYLHIIRLISFQTIKAP
jgi:hypothetical protein